MSDFSRLLLLLPPGSGRAAGSSGRNKINCRRQYRPGDGDEAFNIPALRVLIILGFVGHVGTCLRRLFWVRACRPPGGSASNTRCDTKKQHMYTIQERENSSNFSRRQVFFPPVCSELRVQTSSAASDLCSRWREGKLLILCYNRRLIFCKPTHPLGLSLHLINHL